VNARTPESPNALFPESRLSRDAIENLPPHLSVVVPAYNEEARIGATLQRMLEYLDAQPYRCEIIVVDDGSTDRTREVVAAVPAGRTSVSVLHYDGNRGKGYAVRFGMLRANGNFVLFSDADLSTPIEEVEHLFTAMEDGAEIAIGSRDVAGSRLERHQSWFRELGGKGFNRLVRMVAVPGIHDTQCGFKLFTRGAAQNIFSLCQVDNFSFDIEALYLGRQLGYRVAEVPVRWKHMDGSKVSLRRDAIRMIRTLFRIRATDYQIKRAETKRFITP
jgi:dolichyl-phosphate beta-glucosyltransferase